MIIKFLLFLFYTSRVPFLNMNNNINHTKIYHSEEHLEDYINDFEKFNETKYNITYYKNYNKNDAAMIPLKDISLNHDKVKIKIKEYMNKQRYINNQKKKK